MSVIIAFVSLRSQHQWIASVAQIRRIQGPLVFEIIAILCPNFCVLFSLAFSMGKGICRRIPRLVPEGGLPSKSFVSIVSAFRKWLYKHALICANFIPCVFHHSDISPAT
jgi:hypothetical protein